MGKGVAEGGSGDAAGRRTGGGARRAALAILLVLWLALPTASGAGPVREGELPLWGARVVRSHPHDRQAFTQGLVFHGGFLYESTGLHGASSLRKVVPETGQVVRRRLLDPHHFGEGLAVWEDRLLQLTWQSRIGFVYDLESFALRGTFAYDGEGWGLAQDGRRLILSDGTATLRFLDPRSFRETGRMTVLHGAVPLAGLNELEAVGGEVWANIYPTDRVARISLQSGRVTGWIDLSGLLAPEASRGVDVTNGIAHDPRSRRLFVTGKHWPRLFEIELVPRR